MHARGENGQENSIKEREGEVTQSKASRVKSGDWRRLCKLWQLEHSQEVPLKPSKLLCSDLRPQCHPCVITVVTFSYKLPRRQNREVTELSYCSGLSIKLCQTLSARRKSSSRTTPGRRGKHLRGNLSWRGNSLNLSLRECTEGRCCGLLSSQQHRGLWRLSCLPITDKSCFSFSTRNFTLNVLRISVSTWLPLFKSTDSLSLRHEQFQSVMGISEKCKREQWEITFKG